MAIARDKGYRANWIDETLLSMESFPQSLRRKTRTETLVLSSLTRKYRQRNIVERLIGWLKECRRIFSRFEKTAINFAGMIKMAFIERYLRLATK
ncbi:MAG: transposase [Planctomycetaceae bacterium]